MGNGADVKVDSQQHTTTQGGVLWSRRICEPVDRAGSVLTPPQGGTTPLHYAVKSVHPETVKRLMEAGCDAELPDANDETPLTIAKKMADAGGELDSFGRPISGDKVLEIVKILTKEKIQDEN